MRAVCILGSPQAAGSTSTVVAEIIRALDSHSVQTRLYHLSELNIAYCRGCKSCERTGACVHTDDVRKVIEDIFASQLVIVASPSYWGGVTGQMKVFIDRCTPYCDTNPNMPTRSPSTKGAAVAVRAGGNVRENMNLVNTIDHFLGHLGIPLISHFTVEGVGSKDDLLGRPDTLEDAYAFGEKLFALLT